MEKYLGKGAGEGVTSSAWEGVKSKLRYVAAAAFAIGVSVVSMTAPDGAMAIQSRGVLVVQNDPGGRLSDRVAQIQQIRASGTQVRITGGYCNSACTMYLGLPNTCISKRVSFGFHGPMSQFYGMALPRDQFEYWSGVMAAHYPSSIRGWFMNEARHTLVGLKTVSGRELVRLGVREC